MFNIDSEKPKKKNIFNSLVARKFLDGAQIFFFFAQISI